MADQFQAAGGVFGGGGGVDGGGFSPALHHQQSHQHQQHQLQQPNPHLAQHQPLGILGNFNFTGNALDIVRERLGEDGVQKWHQMVAQVQQERAQALLQFPQQKRPAVYSQAQQQAIAQFTQPQLPHIANTVAQAQPSNASLSMASIALGTPTVPAAVAGVATETPAKSPVVSRTRSGARGRGGMRSSRKRRSTGTPMKDSDDESDEEFTMEGVKTKSGRKVHRPAHFDPAVKTPSRRRGPYRRVHDSRICKICQRGNSPLSNMIVFCDGCNAPYHQLCHDPPIDDLVIAVAEAEWFCKSCASKRKERPLRTGLTGQGLVEDEKRTYLASLPLSSLVELIFFCEKAHPDIALYDPDTKSIVAQIRSQAYAAAGNTEDLAPHAERDIPVQGIGSGNGGSAGGNFDPRVPVPSINLELKFPEGRPNYEVLIVRALASMDHPTPSGSPPKAIWEYLSRNFPFLAGREIRSEAQNSLQKLLKNGRIFRENSLYKVNPIDRFVVEVLGQGRETKAGQAADNPGRVAPGGGIKLVPETQDDQMLVEEADDNPANTLERGFSHWFAMTGEAGGEAEANGKVNGMANGVGRGSETTNGNVNGNLDGSAVEVLEDSSADIDAEGIEDVM